ncbi:hypothetical protein B0T22DRAFT_288730 [Podospora appendiculata]|uniref:Uncharacterized protein n=1 Tax=Podospora appendiculata TaxID=314037 RepID=A0AAE1C8B6_9PEZI|nr:hypothetical protein B0T22DRAFT_288730 [Podospora appendiculata]
MTTTTSSAFALATENPYTGADGPGAGSSSDGTTEGASGSSSGNVEISRGGLIAIIVVVSFVAVFGIASAVLFFLAKKHEWKVRETIRKSARKVVTALTPRRSEFPKSVKQSGGRGGRFKLNDVDAVPPTPRIKPEHLDLEKALDKPEKKRSNFSRK